MIHRIVKLEIQIFSVKSSLNQFYVIQYNFQFDY
jgi:hypothetical protein